MPNSPACGILLLIPEPPKTLREFNAVQVIFREFIPFASRTDHAYYTFVIRYRSLNTSNFIISRAVAGRPCGPERFYKQRLTDLLSGKRPERVLITDYAKISFDDSLSNNVIVEFSLE